MTKAQDLTLDDMVLVDLDSGTAEWGLVERVHVFDQTVEVDYDVSGGIITRTYEMDDEVET